MKKIGILLFALFVPLAQAQFLYHDSATTDSGEFGSNFAIDRLKNAGHSSPNDTEDANVGSESYATSNPPVGGFPVTITLEFDSATSLVEFYLWNHANNGSSGAPANGAGAFTLAFFDAPGGAGNQIGQVFNGNADPAPSGGLFGAQRFDFETTYTDVRSVVFTITQKQGGSTSGFVAVREIAFNSVPGSPPAEPITYVDAIEGPSGNTFATGGSLADTNWVGPDSSAINQTQWNKRSDAGVNGASTFQGAHTGGNLPELTTQLTGLADGYYRIWAFYWDEVANDTDNWVLSAGLSSGTLPTYRSPESPPIAGTSATGVFSAAHLNFATPTPSAVSGALSLFGASLGEVLVLDGAPVNVYLDNNLANGTPNRAWYDGIGYSLLGPPPVIPDKIAVYLVGGQSNADGYGVTASLTPDLREPRAEIDFYHGNAGGSSSLTANQWIPLQPGSGSKPGNANGFGSELSFGIDMHHALGSKNARIAVIKHALGASNLHTDWFPGGDNTTNGDGPTYREFQDTVNSALTSLAGLYPGATILLEGMIWHQGEGDSGSDVNAAAYETTLTNFIADVRATYGANLKFGIAQLSDNQTSLDPTRRATVKEAQAAVAQADPFNYLVITDDQPMGGGSAIHFGTAEMLTIGSRFATGMKQAPITDNDGNGLDDDWEEFYWGAGNTGQDPAGQNDQDFLTNLEEYLWLTNPLVSNTLPVILPLSNEKIITWPSSPDRRYSIEISSDLTTWQKLDSFIPGSAGTTSSYLLPADPATPARFYRVGVQR